MIKLRYLAASTMLLSGIASAQNDTRVTVTVENLTPKLANFQTPVWIGFHDGQSFDLYDTGLPVAGPMAPVGNDAVERLAEDGTTSVLAAEFLASGAGVVEGTIFSPTGAIAPGQLAVRSFLLDSTAASSRYFSYASMVIPSNDAFLANGNPMDHPVFDAQGAFVFSPFFSSRVLDAGTEVNDEAPANTAFFGQMAPNTGITENGVVLDHPGFLPAGSGGILDAPMFRESDFSVPGYPLLKFKLRAAAAVTEMRDYGTFSTGAQEVPAVNTPGTGRFVFQLRNNGESLRMIGQLRQLTNVVAMHLHMAPAGQNGPVIVNLIEPRSPGGGSFGPMVFDRELTTADLTGPMAGFPIDALINAMESGNVYLNVHTNDGMDPVNTGAGDQASGEVRGQLMRL